MTTVAETRDVCETRQRKFGKWTRTSNRLFRCFLFRQSMILNLKIPESGSWLRRRFIRFSILFPEFSVQNAIGQIQNTRRCEDDGRVSGQACFATLVNRSGGYIDYQ